MSLKHRLERLEHKHGDGDEWIELMFPDGSQKRIVGPHGLILGMLRDAKDGRIPERFRGAQVLRQSDGGGLAELALAIAFSPSDPKAEPKPQLVQ